MTSLLRSHPRTLIACALACLLLPVDTSWAGDTQDGKTLPKPRGLLTAPATFVLDGSESVQRVVVTGVTVSDEDLTTDYSRVAQ
jgi:methionine-rich copper-binding protein CopC